MNDHATNGAETLFADFIPVAVESGPAAAAEGPVAGAGTSEPEPHWRPL